MNRKYVPPESITRPEFNNIVQNGTSSEVCQAIVDITHSGQDYAWIRERLETMLGHDNSDVRGVTITCIGHLARLYDVSNIDDLVELIAPLGVDKELNGLVEETLDILNTNKIHKVM